MTSQQRIRGGLVRRLVLWVAASTTISLGVFAAVAYTVLILQEEAEPERDAPEIILREARAEVGEAMLIAAPIGLLLAIAGAAVAARRTLRPLDQVIHSATRITARELSERLPVPASQDEVRAVVLALNGLLTRLETGFDALDRFAADASHELRTPLTVIATELEVLLQNPRSNLEWETSARLCLDEVRHLAQLVSALLDMARADGKPREPSVHVELRTLVERVLAVIAPRARERGVVIEVNLGDVLERTVWGDADALMSALTNVIDNAVQYTPSGGEVRIWALADSEVAVQLHVDDSGPGIAADEWEHIFEPFARGGAGRANSHGFGLGLAISRRICDHNRAALSVGQSPRGGARFSFVFGVSPGG
jgi:two-component system heavy metal sensor histidine kinase CusS